MSHQEHREEEQEFSLKSLFVPLTTVKAIHIIVIVGFIVFGNMLFNGFVWDDKSFIAMNPDVHTVNIVYLFGQNAFNGAGEYRPIPAIYFANLYSLFTTNVFFYHLFQAFIHISNTILLFFIFKHFFHKHLSFFLVLIFLVHPIQVESVSYIAATGNPLFFLFGAIALLLSLKTENTLKTLIIIGILLLLALLTKETSILFIMSILLFRILFKKKNFTNFLITSFVSIGAYSFIRFIIAGVYFWHSDIVPIAKLSFVERLVNMPTIIFYYLKTIFYPLQLNIEQLWVITSISFTNFYLPLLIDALFFLAAGLLGVYLYKKKHPSFRKFLYFFLWFLVGLAFHLQIFPLNMTVADRWFYFTFVGLLGLIGVGIENLKISDPKLRNMAYLMGIIILLLLGVRTIERNTNWSDASTLYTHDSQIHTNYSIENRLGGEYLAIEQYGKALEHFTKSTEMFPTQISLGNVAYVYEKTGNIEKAKEYYLKAYITRHYSSLSQEHVSGLYIRLANVLFITNNYKEASSILQAGVAEYPNSAEMWANLAFCNYKLQKHDEALVAADKARALLPNSATNNLYNKILNNEALSLPTQ